MPTQTIFATDKVRLTVHTTTPAERDYYARAAQEEKEWQEREAIRVQRNEAAKYEALCDRLGAVIERDHSPLGDIRLEALGKTKEGVEAAISDYLRRWPANPYATGFYAVHQTAHGFRAVGHRWDHT